ncbi:unnamed protein product [Caenorhabditis sp. 36 PRJEB53466]|nr:unnamed protein product [Caenorhabditis sp. 36 PRJEB53466]
MNALYSVLLVLYVSCDTITSLMCESCDGVTCFDRDRWVQELCPPSTQFCYRLSSNGSAFRRGCTDFPCATLPGYEIGMECRTCSQDRCNNERDNVYHQHGGGVSWTKGTENEHVLGILTVLSLCSLFSH